MARSGGTQAHKDYAKPDFVGGRASHLIFVNGVCGRAETGALTLVGPIDPQEAKAVVDPDSYNERIDLTFSSDAGERLVRRLPAMELGQGAGGFAALYGMTPDRRAVIDELLPGNGSYVCAGFSGHGFKLAPPVGLMAADMLIGQTAASMDRGLFPMSRLAPNDLLRSCYEYSIVG